MTLEECYESFKGDYEEVVNRLCSRKFVEKFLVKFLADKSYEDLHRYLDEEKSARIWELNPCMNRITR